MPWPSPSSLYTGCDFLCCGITLWPVWVSHPGRPPAFMCTCSLAVDGKLKSHWLRITIPEQQPKHPCVTNIALILNPKHSTLADAEKTIIPAKTRTQPQFRCAVDNEANNSGIHSQAHLGCEGDWSSQHGFTKMRTCETAVYDKILVSWMSRE